MEEAKVCHDINEFLTSLGYEEESTPREKIVEIFKSQKNHELRSDLLQICVNKLDKISDKKFKPKYDNLKTENLSEVDAVTYMLAKICNSSELSSFFRVHKILANRATKSTSANISVNDSVLSKFSDSCSLLKNEDLENSGTVANCSMKNYSMRSVDAETCDERDGGRRVTVKVEHTSDERNIFSLDYSIRKLDVEESVHILNELPVSMQESLLVEDLIHVLGGLDGNYIRVQSGPSKRYFLSLVQECDPLLKKLVDRIIAICPSYSLVVSFNENNDNCLVNQALNAFISANIKEYFVLLSQLEIMDHQKALTLQKMWYIINPFFPNFEILSSVCNRIRKGGCVGGAVLSILHEKTQNVVGNMKAYAFCLEMTKTACEPYFRILEHWLTRGTIHDPYGEFFIEENKQLKGEEIEDDIYWEHYFQIIPNRVPLFLKKFADKIFMTGKYISVIRKTMKECANLPKCERFEYTGEERIFYQTIENSYASVSKMLLNLMLKDLQLLEHIKTIKHYFLMDQADFIEEFMDAASDELCKDINDLMPARLESLLQLAVRTSVINDESHADNLGIEVISESILYQFSKVLSYGDDEVDDQLDELNDDMNGYQAVALKYKVKWPLTLILNHNTLKYYQMLFRYQFYCKSIEKQLKSIWLNWKNTKSRCMKDSNNRAALLIGFLRQKMMNFVQNLCYYMSVEVIEPNFHMFIEKAQSNVHNIDEMIAEHNKMVENILNSCMMNDKYAFRHVSKMLQLCVSFYNLVKKYSSDTTIKDFDADTFTLIEQLHEEFVENFKKLLNAIINQQRSNYSTNMLHILYRLDFNEFYSSGNFSLAS